MTQRIIYTNTDGGVSIVIPTTECLQTHTIQEIAVKDVPAGISFWIVDESEIPSDRTDRNTWVLNETELGEPDGVGGETSEFESEE